MKLILATILSVLAVPSFAQEAEFVPVCMRSEGVKEALEKAFDKPCHQVTLIDLITKRDLKLDAANLHIRRGDLSGFVDLEELEIGASNFSGYREDEVATIEPGSFRDLPSLRQLALGALPLRKLELGTFEGLEKLKRLYFWHVEFTTLPKGVFRELPGLTLLHFGFMPIKEVEIGAFEGLTSIENIHIKSSLELYLPESIFADLPTLKFVGLNSSTFSNTSKGALEGAFEVDIDDPKFGVEPTVPWVF